MSSIGLKMGRISKALRLPVQLQWAHPVPIPSKQGALRQGRASRLCFHVAGSPRFACEQGSLYAASWVERGTLKWKYARELLHCYWGQTFLPSTCRSSVVHRDMQQNSSGHVLFSQPKLRFPWFLPSNRIPLFCLYYNHLKKEIILFWHKPLGNYINRMKYKYVFSPLV